MRYRYLFLFCLLFVLGNAGAKRPLREGVRDSSGRPHTYAYYQQQLNSLMSRFQADTLQHKEQIGDWNSPYYYRMAAPVILYRNVLRNQFQVRWKPQLQQDTLPELVDQRDSVLLLHDQMDRLFGFIYADYPALVDYTEQEMDEMGTIREDISAVIHHDVSLVDQADIPGFFPDLGEEVPVVVHKPNFWRFYGSSSMQFYQYYNSKNWYKDRTDNYYNLLASVKLGARYDNKRTLQWESNLEWRLGFRPYPKDTEHPFKTSDDLIRINTKVGYKATKHWNYTLFMEGTTQLLRSYQDNSNKIRSQFMSPFSSVVSLGMEYSVQLKRFSFSANLAPVAYNFKYVSRPEVATIHGIKENRVTDNKFGPFIKIDYNWKIIDNIEWVSRVYWFSDLSMNVIEWENTFNFRVNRFIKAQLFLYPRFDDSSPNYRSPVNDGFFMFKQWLSLGVEYSF